MVFVRTLRDRNGAKMCIPPPIGHNAAKEPVTMRVRELRALLDEVPDTRELILRRPESTGSAWAAAHEAWSDAHEEAEQALGRWRRSGGQEAYAAYRAAQDREDAAQDSLFLAVAAERVQAYAAGARDAVIAR